MLVTCRLRAKPCRPCGSYMSLPRQLLVSYMSATCQLHVSYLPVTCQLFVSYISAICHLLASYMSVTCQLHISYLRVAFRLFVSDFDAQADCTHTRTVTWQLQLLQGSHLFGMVHVTQRVRHMHTRAQQRICTTAEDSLSRVGEGVGAGGSNQPQFFVTHLPCLISPLPHLSPHTPPPPT